VAGWRLEARQGGHDLAGRWIATKATRAQKTVAGYRSLLDTLVLPRWGAVPLRDVTFDGLQGWVSGLSVSGSTRFHGKGLSASRVIQTHRVVSQVLGFAVKSKYLPANPADGIELPHKHDETVAYRDAAAHYRQQCGPAP
jgi:site-specific recombinase XerC